jgi:hypothetical protein
MNKKGKRGFLSGRKIKRRLHQILNFFSSSAVFQSGNERIQPKVDPIGDCFVDEVLKRK